MRASLTCLVFLVSISSIGVTADLTITLPGGVPMNFNYIPPGTFMMGSPVDEIGRDLDENLHQVTLTRGYFLTVTTVTQEQWEALTGLNPSDPAGPTSCTETDFGIGPNHPVYCVSWEDVAESGGFAELLNTHLENADHPLAGSFRLPTEAEWERAARAGTQTAFSHTVPEVWDTGCGSIPEAEPYMWWCGNSNGQSRPVGSKLPNPYGLFDMHGGVYEWVNDRWTHYLGYEPVVDPPGSDFGTFRTHRGGSWAYLAHVARSASRAYEYPWSRRPYFGFRLAVTRPAGIFSDGFELGDTSVWSETVE